MARIQLQSVNKSFDSTKVIKGVNLDISSGEFVVFVGPSGCGKSTLLRLIAGLESVSSGQIAIDDVDVTKTAPAKRQVAMVFQSYALYPHMKVRKNIGFGLLMTGADKAFIEQKVEQAADILQLGSLLDRHPRELSGGQRQRVAIGRAIVRDPKVFLFDEPLSNLDVELRVEMRLQIARLKQNMPETTMIYVTHDQVEAMTMADKIVVLRDGLIEQVGTPEQIYNQPSNVFVASFIGSPKMNFFSLAIEQSASQLKFKNLDLGLQWTAGQSEIGIPLPKNLTIGIRPQDILLDSSAQAPQMTVELVENHGPVSYLYGNLANGSSVVVEQKDGDRIQSGQQVGLHFPQSLKYLFDSDGQAFSLPIEY